MKRERLIEILNDNILKQQVSKIADIILDEIEKSKAPIAALVRDDAQADAIKRQCAEYGGLPARCLITERNWSGGKIPARCRLCPDADQQVGKAADCGPDSDPCQGLRLMLARIIQQHRAGRDLTETLDGAADLLRRQGRVFRAPAGDVPGEAQTKFST